MLTLNILNIDKMRINHGLKELIFKLSMGFKYIVENLMNFFEMPALNYLLLIVG